MSTVAILCRDCNNDVGLYPGKHKCPPRPAMPAMPAIPAQYQQEQQSSYSSRGMNGGGASGGRRPPDLNPGSLHSGGGGYGSSSSSSSRTPTSSNFQERTGGSAGNGSGAKTPTAMSFQERLKERDREKQQRDREEREAAARSVREGNKLHPVAFCLFNCCVCMRVSSPRNGSKAPMHDHLFCICVGVYVLRCDQQCLEQSSQKCSWIDQAITIIQTIFYT